MGPIIDNGKDCVGVGIVRGKRYVYLAKTDKSQPSTTTTPSGEAISNGVHYMISYLK